PGNTAYHPPGSEAFAKAFHREASSLWDRSPHPAQPHPPHQPASVPPPVPEVHCGSGSVPPSALPSSENRNRNPFCFLKFQSPAVDPAREVPPCPFPSGTEGASPACLRLPHAPQARLPPWFFPFLLPCINESDLFPFLPPFRSVS